MAIENAKTLNVRIRNKYDSYENWAKSGLVLEAGEIALVYTTVNVDIGNGKIETHPELLMKCGNGTDTFTALPWLSAKAADVPAWSKAATKPTYSADEITNMDSYIADYVSEQMGIEVDTDTKYQLVKVDDYNYKLQSKGKTDTAWADVADSVIVIPNDTAAIEALQTLVGDTKVATQITNAITALDLVNTYEAKGETAKVQTALNEYKTSNDATVAGHTTKIGANESAISAIKDGTTIDSFKDVEDALAEKQAVGDYATKTEAQGYANAKDEAIAAAKKAGDDAVEAAATAQGEIDALEAKVGTVPENQTVMGIITNIQENAYDDTDIKADIKANSDAIDALETKVGEKPVAEQISTAIANEKLAETYAAKVHKHEIADVNGLSDAIADAKKAGTDAAAALGEYKTANDAAVKANADAIDAVETTIGTVTEGKTVVEMIADAKTEATYDDTALVGRVTANEGAIATLNGEGAGSVKKTVDDALNDFATKVSNDGVVNTYKELVDYAAENGSDMATLTGKISALETTVGKAAEGETAATGLVKDVAELETKVGDKTVAAQIEAAIEALKIGDYAKAADLTAAVNQHNTDKTALETEIAKKANDADLAAIAKTGSTDDLVQGELVLVFDCGNSGVVAE
jgi:hypothetical protein